MNTIAARSMSSAVTGAAESPLSDVAQNTHLSKDEKLSKASKAFEAMLLRNILENAQKPVLGSKMLADSATGAIYRDMATTQLADSIAQSGSFGLATMLEAQLRRPAGKQEQHAEVPTEPRSVYKHPKLSSPKNSI